jgi:hypothetical protein
MRREIQYTPSHCAEIKKDGAVLLLPHITSWRAKGHVYPASHHYWSDTFERKSCVKLLVANGSARSYLQRT